MIIGTSAYGYACDANGNVVTEAVSRHFGWNHADRLASFATQVPGAEPSVHAHYLYDAAGRRVTKLVRKQGGSVEVTHYIDALFEHHRWDGGTAAGQNNHVHVMDDQQRIALVRAGAAHPDDRGPETQFHLSDHLGSSNVVADAGGALVNREEFSPYGETSFGSFARKRYRFTGKERDEESGLSYHQARYYSSWLARWMTVDPECGAFPGYDPYCYCTGNPMVLTDPSGQGPKDPKEPSILTGAPAQPPSGGPAPQGGDEHLAADVEAWSQRTGQFRNRQNNLQTSIAEAQKDIEARKFDLQDALGRTPGADEQELSRLRGELDASRMNLKHFQDQVTEAQGLKVQGESLIRRLDMAEQSMGGMPGRVLPLRGTLNAGMAVLSRALTCVSIVQAYQIASGYADYAEFSESVTSGKFSEDFWMKKVHPYAGGTRVFGRDEPAPGLSEDFPRWVLQPIWGTVVQRKDFAGIAWDDGRVYQSTFDSHTGFGLAITFPPDEWQEKIGNMPIAGLRVDRTGVYPIGAPM
jgi:RHS repeat-associated protein